ncbi:MAG: isoprenyl transferase [Deltaproteobacteria bacterium]|nr:isoprenyl transferase [Deltaproteobacteria bacterium]
MDKLLFERLPRHIAIIMDGNGRWAMKKRLTRIKGHRKGVEAARDVVTFSRELGIEYLTLYTFSRDNWNRPAYEVRMLMAFLERHLRSEAPSMIENNIRFRAVGNMRELPPGVRGAVEEVEEKTRTNSGMNLQLAISYSARAEIADACRAIAEKVRQGVLRVDDIDEDTVGGSLYTAGIPDPDLLIRTSGERRLSNFLLWQVAYTELYITDVLWPDFTREDLLMAIRDFQTRERRFGLTREQLDGVMG